MTNLIETVYNESATFTELSILSKQSEKLSFLQSVEVHLKKDTNETYGGDIYLTTVAGISVKTIDGWITTNIETPGIFGLSSDIEIDPHCYETELYTLFEILEALNVDCNALNDLNNILDNMEVFA